jgi:hypothetical protein
MEPPVYEYDQVLTCGELENVGAQLVILIDSIPFWRFIEKWKYKIALHTVDDLHLAMHKKQESMKLMRQMEEPNEESY